MDGCIQDLKLTRRDIHTRVVRTEVGRKDPKRVLGTKPPEINEDKVDLTRGERKTLAQMRSGFCSAPKYFQNRVGLSASLLCLCCRQAEHTAQPMFQCTELPALKIPLNIWEDPKRAVEYLLTWPCFESRLLSESLRGHHLSHHYPRRREEKL